MVKNLVYIATLLTILAFSIFGRNGFLEYLKFDQQLVTLRARLNDLKSETNSESNTLYGINNNPGYLEKIARENLGLSKKGEVIYIFDDKANKDNCPQDTSCSSDER
jgi:cell division protein FtsB